MRLGKQVVLGLGHIVVDGDPAGFPQKGAEPPNFWPMTVLAKWQHGTWIKMSFNMDI